MFRSTLIIIIMALGLVIAPIASDAGQQKRAAYGPVVASYLTNLAEELNELEFQLTHREISRDDYGRARQRLLILRRFVESRAANSREDLVPEYQILTADEFGMLGLSRKPEPSELKIGDLIGGQWKLIGVEQSRLRFFVFERLPDKVIGGVIPERKLGDRIDPRTVIETVVITEQPEPAINPPSQLTQIQSTQPATAPAEMVKEVEKPERTLPPAAAPLAPRILHIFLPQYTEKARAKGVEGELIIRALFQRDGKIKGIKVEKELGYGLEQKAIESVRRIGFQPARSSGRDVDAQALIVFNFTLMKVTAHVQAAEANAKPGGIKP